MTRPRLATTADLERDSIRLSIKTLEARAAASSEVVVSAQFAFTVAQYLKRLLQVAG